jgi:DNA-binding transcriptional ArsR family regulator
MKYDMEMGRVYLSKERKPRQSIDALKEMMMVGHSGTLISRRSKKDYRESIGYAFNLVRISEMGTGSRVPPKYNAVRKLLADLPGGEVVHIDCIEYLMSRIGPKKTLNLIQDLRDLAVSKNLCVLLTVDPLAVPDPELNLIEKESRPIMPSKSQFGLSAKLVDTLAYINETYIEDASPSYSDIGAHFKLSKPTTRSRIKQLQDLGIVREVQKGRKKLLEVTEKGKNYLAS